MHSKNTTVGVNESVAHPNIHRKKQYIPVYGFIYIRQINSTKFNLFSFILSLLDLGGYFSTTLNYQVGYYLLARFDSIGDSINKKTDYLSRKDGAIVKTLKQEEQEQDR